MDEEKAIYTGMAVGVVLGSAAGCQIFPFV